jgi:hypothetical protein
VLNGGTKKAPAFIAFAIPTEALWFFPAEGVACGLTFRARFREKLPHTGLIITELIMLKLYGHNPRGLLTPQTHSITF